MQLQWGYHYLWLSKTDAVYDSGYVLDHLKHKVTFSAGLPVLERTVIHLQGRYLERSGGYTDWNDQDNSYYQAYTPFFLWDVKVQHQLKAVFVWITVQNLFNTAYIDYGPIEQPGRWIRFGVRTEITH